MKSLRRKRLSGNLRKDVGEDGEDQTGQREWPVCAALGGEGADPHVAGSRV